MYRRRPLNQRLPIRRLLEEGVILRVPLGQAVRRTQASSARAQLSGLAAVVAGDVAIAVAAILGIVFATRGSVASSALPQVVAILSSGFTAIGTMTTAYFGIKSMSNTANSLAGPPTGSASGTSDH